MILEIRKKTWETVRNNKIIFSTNVFINKCISFYISLNVSIEIDVIFADQENNRSNIMSFNVPPSSQPASTESRPAPSVASSFPCSTGSSESGAGAPPTSQPPLFQRYRQPPPAHVHPNFAVPMPHMCRSHEHSQGCSTAGHGCNQVREREREREGERELYMRRAFR